MQRIAVIGIGNLLMQDDGVGIQVLKELGETTLPPEVELIDGGTHSYDLVEFFCQADHIIVIDAVQAGGVPGTIYRAPLEHLNLTPKENMTSVHEMSFVEALYMVNLLGHQPRVLVYGVEPGSLELGLELTAVVAAKVPRLVELIREDIQRLQETGEL